MNLSMKWLSEFVDIDVNPKEFSERMTLTGSKVETFELEGEKINNVVVGKILSIDKHPDADKLVVCMVDIGKSDPIQIVTGAKNLKVGDLVPAALDGSTLSDGTKIKKGKLRGIVSNGMLCSLGELGLNKSDFPYAISDGIFVLQEDCHIGQDIRDAIGLNDVVVDFEITPNRPDCLSIIGLAREAAATFDKNLKLHIPKIKASASCSDFPFSVSVKNKEKCPYYSARIIKNVKIGTSPKWIRERLRAMGVRSINNIVDITNYVMLEYGQPLHAFDYDLIADHSIVVRDAVAGEKIVTLDSIERSLKENNLVIADSEKPLAIAGVMGGEGSGISENTKTVVFESANFKGSSVRNTSRQHALRTDSSARFEKGLDANLCKDALDRACELIELLGIGEVCDTLFEESNYNKEKTKIFLDVDFINKFLNISLSYDQMKNILEKLDCVVKDNYVIVPTFRADLVNKFDLAEEIARFYGYNNIKSTLLEKGHYGKFTNKQKFNQTIKNTLLALGLDEILTYSFMSRKNYDKLMVPQDDEIRNCVSILNPLGEDTSVMRTTALPSMLETLSRNFNNKNEQVKFFEIVREYINNGEMLPEEKNKVIAGMYGKNIDFFTAKGYVEDLLDALNIKEYRFSAVSDKVSYHPGRCAQINCRGEVIGIIGEVHPIVAKNYNISERIISFTIDIDKAFNFSKNEKKYKPIAKFPSVNRDLALLCDKNLPVASIQDIIIKSAGNILEKINIFDVYTGEQVPDDKKSVAFSLIFRSESSTLKEDDVSKVIKNITSALEKFKIYLRV